MSPLEADRSKLVRMAHTAYRFRAEAVRMWLAWSVPLRLYFIWAAGWSLGLVLTPVAYTGTLFDLVLPVTMVFAGWFVWKAVSYVLASRK